MARLQSSYFGICDEGPKSCFYGCLCPICLTAQVKAELDGRVCGICDCCCMAFPYNQIAIRRQMRLKYGLELDIAENAGGCLLNPLNQGCTGTYAEDCWLPCLTSCAVETMVGWFTPSWSKSVGNVLHTMQLCQTSREVRKLSRSTGDMELNQMFYGRLLNVPRTGAAEKSGGTYAHHFFGCFDDLPVCLYTFFCCWCAVGYATAMVQDRRCDALDCCSHYSAYELRKTVQTKYGISHPPKSYALGSMLEPCIAGVAECLKERDEDIHDGCCAAFCFLCQINQDYRELKQRSLTSVNLVSYGAVPTQQPPPPPSDAPAPALVTGHPVDKF